MLAFTFSFTLAVSSSFWPARPVEWQTFKGALHLSDLVGPTSSQMEGDIFSGRYRFQRLAELSSTALVGKSAEFSCILAGNARAHLDLFINIEQKQFLKSGLTRQIKKRPLLRYDGLLEIVFRIFARNCFKLETEKREYNNR